MSFLDTRHKRKSAGITAIILALLLLVIFSFGMRYFDPPKEYGLAINLGNTNFGSGDPIEKTKTQPEPQKVPEKVPEEVPKKIAEPVKETSSKTAEQDIITKKTKEAAPVIKKGKTKKIKQDLPVVEKTKPKETKPIKKPKKQTPKPKPKPSKATQDALNNLLKGNSSDGKPKGEGDDTKAGVKGNKNGDLNSSKYYGNEGSGSGGNYNLSGRKAIAKPIKKPDCQEEGIVVVSIEVDRSGRVIKAVPGVKGSTNTAPCLLKPAKEAALKTQWNTDNNAPFKQKGTIIYKFSLSK